MSRKRGESESKSENSDVRRARGRDGAAGGATVIVAMDRIGERAHRVCNDFIVKIPSQETVWHCVEIVTRSGLHAHDD